MDAVLLVIALNLIEKSTSSAIQHITLTSINNVFAPKCARLAYEMLYTLSKSLRLEFSARRCNLHFMRYRLPWILFILILYLAIL